MHVTRHGHLGFFEVFLLHANVTSLSQRQPRAIRIKDVNGKRTLRRLEFGQHRFGDVGVAVNGLDVVELFQLLE